MPLVSFPLTHQENLWFPLFSGGVQINKWHETSDDKISRKDVSLFMKRRYFHTLKNVFSEIFAVIV